MKIIISVFIAYLLDLVLADPYSWPHPVKLMGNYINYYLKRSNYQLKSRKQQIRIGVCLNLSLLAITVFTSLFFIMMGYQINNYLGWMIEIYLIYSCFSCKGLVIEARKVRNELSEGGLVQGRKQVAMIVGRNTENLTEEEIVKATIETVAENTSDGFVAPLLYIMIFGPIGGLCYKAINTLDSMVGYKQSPYTYVGYFSAKLDDYANWLPARITWLLLILSSFILGLDWRNAIKIGLRDRRNHSSLNSAYPESVVAGALRIQLGGTHEYYGETVYKPTIGEAEKVAALKDIDRVNHMLLSTSILSVVVMSIIQIIIDNL
ncbi:adenosylcobinamide-phosphate synthase CbiB [Aerococcaceae bacterium WGS1372]